MRIQMNFHCAGLTTPEYLEVVNENDDTISLATGGDEIWRFDKKTGKCINDETAFGCYRTINPINGRIPAECPECGGRGAIYLSHGDGYTCNRCKGQGTIEQ